MLGFHLNINLVHWLLLWLGGAGGVTSFVLLKVGSVLCYESFGV